VIFDDETRRAWEVRFGQPAPTVIPQTVRQHLPDLEGRHVLQLFCGHGRSTAELVELGALVTAIDDMESAITATRARAPDAAAVVANANDVPIELRRGRFDLVYCDDVSRLRDLSGAAAALRAGGGVALVGEHPAAICVDPIDLRWREDYFEQQTLGALVSLVVDASLAVEALHELPSQRRRLDKRVPATFVLLATKT
jgi:SAM-dependent methyltransferase